MSWPALKTYDDYLTLRDFVREAERVLPRQSAGVRDRLIPEVAEGLARLEEYEKWNPGASFEPWREGARFWAGAGGWKDCFHTGQAKAHELLVEGVRFLFITSGNRWGKTFFAGKEGTDHALSEPDRLILVDGESFLAHRDDIQKALWQLRIESELAPKQRAWTPDSGFGREDPKLSYLRRSWARGSAASTFIFRTYEQPSVKLGGIDATMIIYNEPPPMSHLHEGYLRVSTRQGTILVVATFVTADEVYEHVMRAVDERGDRIWFHMRGRSVENPSFSVEEEKRLLETLDDDEARARLDGEPIRLGGRCYWAFSDGPPWVVADEEVPDRRDLILFEGIDCHPTKPLAYLLFGADSKGVIWVIDELWWKAEDGGSLRDFERLVWESRHGRRFEEEEWQFMRRTGAMWDGDNEWCMPRFTIYDSPQKESGHDQDRSLPETLQVMLQSLFVDAKRLVMTDRIKHVNDVFLGARNPVTWELGVGTRSDPRPMCRIAARCMVTRRQLRRVQWEIRTTEVSRERLGVRTGRKQQRDEDFTDIIDYAVTMVREGIASSEVAVSPGDVVRGVHPLVKRNRARYDRGQVESDDFDPFATA